MYVFSCLPAKTVPAPARYTPAISRIAKSASSHKTKSSIIPGIALFLSLFLTLSAHSAEPTDVAILEPLKYTDLDSLRKIQEAVMPAAEAGNIIAVNIARQTMYALGQDMLLEKTEYLRTMKYDPKRKDIQDWLAQVRNKADRGDPFFQVVLGTLYSFGICVEEDGKRVFEWWQKAAEAGYPDGVYKISLAYWKGIGVPVDKRIAVEYAKKAADLDHPMALYNMGCYHRDGEYMPHDLVKAKFYWLRSAKMGHAESQYNLGWVYMYRYGGDRTFSYALTKKLARDWYAKAAAQGHAKAKRQLPSPSSNAHDYSRPSIPLPRDIKSNPLIDSFLNEYKKPSTRKNIPTTRTSTPARLSTKEPALKITSEVNSRLSKERTANLGKAAAEGQIVVAVIPAQGKQAPPPESVAEMEVAFSKHANVILVERQEIEKILRELNFSAGGYVSLETRLALSRIIPAHTMLFVEKLGSAKNSPLAIQAVDTRTGVNSGTWVVESSKTDDTTDILPEITSRILESSRIPYEQKHCISLIGIRNEHQKPELEQFASALHTLCCRQLANTADIVLLDRHHLEHLRKEKHLTAIEQQLLGSTVIVEGGIQPSDEPEQYTVTMVFKRPDGKQQDDLMVNVSAGSVYDAAVLISTDIAKHIGVNNSVITAFAASDESEFFSHQSLLHAYWGQPAEALKMAETAYALDPNNENCLALASNLKAVALDTGIQSPEALSLFLRADRLVVDLLQKELALSIETGSTNFPVFRGQTGLSMKHGLGLSLRTYWGLYLPRIMPLHQPEAEHLRTCILDIEDQILRLQLKYCANDYDARAYDFWIVSCQRMTLCSPNHGILDYYPGDVPRQLALLKDIVSDFADYAIPSQTPATELENLKMFRYDTINYIPQYMWDGHTRIYSSPDEKQLCYDFCVEMTRHTNSYVRLVGNLALIRMKEDISKSVEAAYQILINELLPNMSSHPPSEIQSVIRQLYSELYNIPQDAPVQPVDYTRRFITHMIDSRQAQMIPTGLLADWLDNMTAAIGAEESVKFIQDVRKKLKATDKENMCSEVDKIFAERAVNYQAELIDGIPYACMEALNSDKMPESPMHCQIKRLPFYLDTRILPFVIAKKDRLFCINSTLGPKFRGYPPPGTQKLSLDTYEIPSGNHMETRSWPVKARFSKAPMESKFDIFSIAMSDDANELFAGTRIGFAHVKLDDEITWLSTGDGLPPGIIRAMAFYDEKVYLGIGSENIHSSSETNYSFFVSYDTKHESFKVLDSERAVQKSNTPLSGPLADIGAIFADRKRNCLWISLSQKAFMSPADRQSTFQFWQYHPSANAFAGLHMYDQGTVVPPNTRLLYTTVARWHPSLFSTDTCDYTRIPTYISKKHHSCEAATWLGNDILYTGSYRGGTANLYLYTPGEKEPKLIDRLPDGSPMPEIVLLTSTDYGVLAVSSKGETFLINPLDRERNR